MKELDKSKVYSLEELTSEQWELLKPVLNENSVRKFRYDILEDYFRNGFRYIHFDRTSNWVFIHNDDAKNYLNIVNAKELFEPQYEVKMIVEAPNEDKPQHYADGIDTFERMEANCTTEECLAFAKGNIDKYNFRKKGQDLEDYKKIISYANWAIKLLNKKQND